MKKFNLSFLVGLTILVSLFMTSCERNEMIEETPTMEETLRFAKEVTITDESGLNSVTLLIESEKDAVLADYDAERYKLLPFFEVPNYRAAGNDVTAILGPQETADIAQISIKSTSFQEGVVSYKLVKKD